MKIRDFKTATTKKTHRYQTKALNPNDRHAEALAFYISIVSIACILIYAATNGLNS